MLVCLCLCCACIRVKRSKDIYIPKNINVQGNPINKIGFMLNMSRDNNDDDDDGGRNTLKYTSRASLIE